MGGPALARPALILYHGLQPRVKPRGAGAPRSTGLGRQDRSRLRTKAILLDPDRGNDAGMSRSVPRADRDGVAGAPPLRCGGMRPAAGGDTEGAESRAALMGAQQSRAARPQPIALHRPRLEAHEKSPGRRNRKGAEKVREDHQGDKAPPVRRPTRKRHNHSLNLWYDCASKRPNGTQFTFLGRFCCFPWFSFSSQHLSAEITSYFIEKEVGARQPPLGWLCRGP